MALRVRAQNENAMKMELYLNKNEDVATVYYPGLETHPDHELAKSQMQGFGGMLSFELPNVDHALFYKHLKLVKPVMSLAGVESTMTSPVTTSHALMSAEDREKQGIKDSLIRFSLGIEETEDIIADIEQAIAKVKALTVTA